MLPPPLGSCRKAAPPAFPLLPVPISHWKRWGGRVPRLHQSPGMVAPFLNIPERGEGGAGGVARGAGQTAETGERRVTVTAGQRSRRAPPSNLPGGCLSPRPLPSPHPRSGSPFFPRLEGSPPAPPSQSPHCERPPLPLGKRSPRQPVLPMDYRLPSGEGGAALLCPAPEELTRRTARQ